MIQAPVPRIMLRQAQHDREFLFFSRTEFVNFCMDNRLEDRLLQVEWVYCMTSDALLRIAFFYNNPSAEKLKHPPLAMMR
jgi:hypothetical protein